jgi:hypothetical protein
MPNDNFRFPRRMVGYGAYNLCFDKQLGRVGTTGPDFFQFIRATPRWNPINLVKVICFREATIEGLPAVRYDANGVPIGRTQPLYRRDGQINPGFTANLLKLVRRANEFGFWVQVCLFHEQAVKADSGGTIEKPENVPAILDALKIGATNCERLTNFFTINDRARLNAQLAVVNAVCGTLRMETNVFFEIANEVRIQGCSATDNALGNCKIVAWLNTLSEAILSAIFWDHEPDCVSTGTGNERVTFDRVNRQECMEPAFRPTFFDFHTGQWKASTDPATYTAGLEGARRRVAGYLGAAPVPRRLPLIINDDGFRFGEETPTEMTQNAKLIKAWAKVAFEKGLHYASKQQYPPGRDWDRPALNALGDVATQVPIPE